MPVLPFADLLAQHRGVIHKIAWAYCRDAALRDDVVQEIVVQLWRAHARYDGRCRPVTWVYRIALNTAISHHRRDGRWRRALQALPAEPIATGDPHDPDRDTELARLRAAIDGLPALDKALVLLHLDGNDHATIGEVLGLSTSNVGTRLHRIKDRLRAAFGAGPQDPEEPCNSTT